MNKSIKQVNKDIKKHIGAEEFDTRVERLVSEGVLEIVGCEDDGTPIVKCTEFGMAQALAGLSEMLDEDFGLNQDPN
jgi:hypothetical protein